MTAARLVLRELARHPLRTASCVAGVAAGAAAYLLLLGTAHGFLGHFQAITRVLGTDVVVHRARATSPWSSNLTPVELDGLQAVPGVAAVARLALGKTAVLGDHYFLLFGLDPGPRLARSLPVEVGRLPAAADETAVGTLAARRLGLASGATLEVRGRALAVTGVYRSGHALLDNGAVTPVELVQELFNLHDGVNVALLAVDDPPGRETVAAEIGRRHPGLEAGAAEAWVSMYGQMALVESYTRLVAVIALLVAMLGVASVVHVALAERTGELAVLRAIGWTRGRVAWLVLGEMALLTALGAAVAVPLAEIVLRLSAPLHARAAGFVPAHVSLAVVPEMVAVTLAAGVLGAAAAIVRAVRIAPARALRMP